MTTFSAADHVRLEVETSAGVWTSITGPTKSIDIERADSDVGTLSAEVIDATLDPTVAATLRPGKGVRVRVRDAAGTGWTPIITCRISDLDVDYAPLARPGKTVRIKITGTDAVNVLANTPEPRGVATINELRWLLGTVVPFNVNGSTSALGAGTVVAYNDSASLWDQILVTRDSVLGYVWVDPTGRLCAYDKATLPTATAAALTTAVYGSLEKDFALSQIINTVNITFLRNNLATGETVEVPYGPYVNAASVAQWGKRSATFTIQGAVDNPTAIAAHANAILAANATAQARVKSVRVPITDTADLAFARNIDLHSRVNVTLPEGGAALPLRVTGISHSISVSDNESRYGLTLSFAVPGSISPPTATPGTGVTVVVEDMVNTGDEDLQDNIDVAVADFVAGLATKSKHTLSPNVPGTTANNAGDVWERHKAGDPTKIIGRWRGAGGTSWTAMNLDATYIPQLDIGTGTFGDLSGTRIAVNTIGVSKLLVTDLTDYVRNPYMVAAVGGWTSQGASGFFYTSDAAYPSPEGTATRYRVAKTNDNAFRTFTQDETLPTRPGESWTLRGSIMHFGAVPTVGDARIGLRWLDASGGVVSDSWLTTPAAGWGNLQWRQLATTSPVQAPAGASYVQIIGAVWNNTDAGSYDFTDLHVKRAVSGSLLVDGAIDGKTITGALMRTAAAGGRVELGGAPGSTAIRFFDSSGAALGSISHIPSLGEMVWQGVTGGTITLTAPTLHLYGSYVEQSPTTFLGNITCTAMTTSATSSAPNVFVNSVGQLVRTSFVAAAASAARFKENRRDLVLDLDSAADALGSIDLAIFDYREDLDDENWAGHKDMLGVFADDAIGTPLENFVIHDTEGEVQSFDYGRAAFVMLHPIARGLRERTEALEQTVADQADLIAALAARLDALEGTS